MLKVINITKSYSTKSLTKRVLKGANLTVSQGDKVAILGRNGAGKSTLIRIIGGLEAPDSGIVQATMSLSWPLGYSGGMQGSLTGFDNINFLCRIYNAHPYQISEFVQDFTELGRHLKEPVKTYSAGMKSRLNFALSMAFDFDCLLIDEGLSAGDSRFTKRCRNALEAKKNKAILMVSHDQESIYSFCDSAKVLEDGKLMDFNSIEAALHYFNRPT